MTGESLVERPRAERLIEGASEVLTVPPSGGLGVLRDVIVAIGGGIVLGVADRRTLGQTFQLDGAETIRLDGGVVAPGFVDSHTHVVFGGSRVAEYQARVAGDEAGLATLDEAGETGIPATVKATRAATTAQLTHGSIARVAEMLDHGTTTIESKSGYGLTVEDEIRLLEVNRVLADRLPVRIVSTFLGAHAVPQGWKRPAYVDVVVREMIPEIARRGLATFCDVYCDDGYFDEADSVRILEAGAAAGLRPKIHLDAYSRTGAAGAAAAIGVVSADHLNETTPVDAASLAAAGTIGVGLPGLDLAVGHPRPVDLVGLAAAGMELALATDICPACWMTSMTLVVQLACRRHRMPIDEAIRAATLGGARAIGLGDVTGSLVPGFAADIQVWDLPSHHDLAYRLGSNPVTLVMSGGTVVVDRRPARQA